VVYRTISITVLSVVLLIANFYIYHHIKYNTFLFLLRNLSGYKIYISLTAHLGIILVNNQLDALFAMYLFPFSTCFEQPSAHHQEYQILLIHHLVYINPYR
jgi:hypothetical protein